MAFPAVAQTAVTDGTTATTTPTINLPGSLTTGNTLFVAFRSAVGGSIGFPDASWVELFDGSPDAEDDQTALAWHEVTGGEGATIDLTSGSGKFGAIVWEVSGAVDPDTQPPEISTEAVATSEFPDPTTVTPTGGSQDYLFLWICTVTGKGSLVTAPTNYSNTLIASSGTPGNNNANVRLHGFERQLTASSEDPGSAEIATSAHGWTAFVAALHPAVAGAARRIFIT